MGWLDDKPKADIEVIEYTQKQPSETSTHHLKDFFYTSLPIFLYYNNFRLSKYTIGSINISECAGET